MNAATEYDTIILDCDGVLLDTNNLKSNAFREALTGYPDEIIKDFIFFHENNNGISRLKKLQSFFGNNTTKKEINKILLKYNKLCEKLYLNCKTSPGYEYFIKCFKEKKKLFVLSGSDEKELKKVFKERNFFDSFDKIYGAPRKKTDVLNYLSKKNKVIFLGDSSHDFWSAKETNTFFIFIRSLSQEKNNLDKLSEKYSIPIFNNLIEFTTEFIKHQ